jgi:dipeptidase E
MTLILASEAAQVLGAVAREMGAPFFKSSFVCITTAGALEPETPWITDEQHALRSLGATTREVELSRLSAAEAESAIGESDNIFVHGGNTFFLLQEMQRVGFERIVASCLGSGRSYVGSSAGALVVGPRIDLVASTDDPSKAPQVDATKGLGLIDIIPFVHFDVPSYWQAFRSSFERAIEQGANILPLRNDQFLVGDGKSFRLVTASL